MIGKKLQLAIIFILSCSCHLQFSSVKYKNLLRTNSKTQQLGDDQTNILINQQYSGQYQTSLNNQFSYLDNKHGNIDVIFFNDPSVAKQNLNMVQIFLFNPIYHDDKAVGILLELNDINKSSWIFTNTSIKTTKYWKTDSQQQQQIHQVVFNLTIQNLKDNNAKNIVLHLNMTGDNFNFTSKLYYRDETLSTVGYCLYATSLAVLQIISALIILRGADRQHAATISKMSLITISICNIEDFYLTMIHIEYIMSSGNGYLFFILPSISYIILFVVFDMKMLFLVWKSHHMRQFQNPQMLRKKLTAFYIQFYLGLFIYLTLTYFFSYQEWLIILQNLIILPQIIHNIRIGNNPGFSICYIFGYLGARIMLPIYIRLCPSNHFMLKPMIILIVCLIIATLLQIFFLFLQKKFGACFFIPKYMLPNYYNYACKLKMNEENKDLQCSICLMNVFSESQQYQQSSVNNLNQTLLDCQTSVMKTPCNHYFHKDCLNKWIDVKLQCPTCRTVIPPIL